MARDIVVGLFGGNLFRLTNQITGLNVMSGIKVANVHFKLTSKLFTNRDELGKPIIDGRFILPTEFTVAAICSTADDVAAVNQIMADTKSMYTVLSRGIYMSGFVFDDEKFKQEPVAISVVPVELHFKQILFQVPDTPICANSGDTATVIGGLRRTAEVGTEKVKELSDKVIKAASSIF